MRSVFLVAVAQVIYKGIRLMTSNALVYTANELGMNGSHEPFDDQRIIFCTL